jgi:hypothetical protein
MPKLVSTKKSRKNINKKNKRSTTSKNIPSNCNNGYCVKCKKKQMMKDCVVVKNMLKGICPVCGTKMNRFIKVR